MNYCTRLFLLLTPALIAFGLLGVAFGTYWWTIPLEKNVPQESLSTVTNDTRLYSALIPLTISRGLFSECIAYRKANILVSNWFDFREEMSPEDQLKLANENCSNQQFTCLKGPAISRPITRCINQRQQCDRVIDCEDKSDELACNGAFHKLDCSSNYAKCPDEQICYRKDEQTCDGVSNCPDNSDEKDCNEEKCRANRHVYCPREKKCARRVDSYRCDGIVDCEDNSDEENCETCNGNTKAFLCDSKCLLPKYGCDGIVHCSDFRDELSCNHMTGASNHPLNSYNKDHLCEEKRFNPFNIYPPKIESSLTDSYPHAGQRMEYLNLMYYLRLIVFYGIAGGLIFILFSIISLFFSACCRHKCRDIAFYLYGIWILLGWLFISIGLLSFVNIWIWRREILLDYERNLPFDTMIHERNPSLQSLEFFGLSFWLACGAALSTFIGLLLSCCICCTFASSRSDNKEYEIMHMQNY